MYKFETEFRDYLKVVVYGDTPQACIARFKDVVGRDARNKNPGWQDAIDEIVETCAHSPERYIEDVTNAVFIDFERIA